MNLIISSAAAAAVLLAGGLVLVLSSHRPTGPIRAVAVTPSEAPRPAARPPEPRAEAAGAPVDSLENRLKESRVILVAAAEGSDPAPPPEIPGDARDVLIHFKVKRVLKGELADKAITTRLSVPPDPDKIVGRDWIVWLSPDYIAGKSQSAPLTAADFEPTLKAILAKDKDKDKDRK